MINVKFKSTERPISTGHPFEPKGNPISNVIRRPFESTELRITILS